MTNRHTKNIRWRRLIMEAGGTDWLLHCSRLWGFSERLCGPDHTGLPPGLAVLVWARARDEDRG